MSVIVRGSPFISASLRDDSSMPMPTMMVRYSKLTNSDGSPAWYKINSYWEGSFMERVAPGAAQFDSAGAVRSLFNHGFDSALGGRALGIPESISEQSFDDGLFSVASVPLFDASYVRDLVPGIRAGAYGSSFMFTVTSDAWDMEPDPSDMNPSGLPERTVTGYLLMEQGPVTWPANPGADAGIESDACKKPCSSVCSGTDWYYEQVSRQGGRIDESAIRSGLSKPPVAQSGGSGKGSIEYARRARVLRMVKG